MMHGMLYFAFNPLIKGRRALVLLLCLTFNVYSSPVIESNQKILYQFARGRIEQGITEYLEYYENSKVHDLQLLERLAQLLLEKGCSSNDMQEQILALYGIRTARTRVPLSHFYPLLRSPHPAIQAATIQVLSDMHDDSIDDMIASALKSDYLLVRIEALYYLAQRQSKQTIGQLEALLNLLHPKARPFFTELYGMCGTQESISRLRQLINDRDLQVRLSALIATAKYGHDELIPTIRLLLNHCDPALKEASSTVLGMLQDTQSKTALVTASESPFQETKLSALLALCYLGDLEKIPQVEALAQDGNLFATYALHRLTGTEKTLDQLLNHSDINVKVNAALALLEQGNIHPRYIIDFLSLDPEVIVCGPHFSIGHTLACYKVWNPLAWKNEERKRAQAMMIEMQSSVLEKSINLPEDSFMEIARAVFKRKQAHLIPLLVRLLENKRTHSALALLEEKSQAMGSPFVRAYSLLALYRLGHSDILSQQFIDWVHNQKGDELLQFRILKERENVGLNTEPSPYKLTPEEKSALFLEALESIAVRHEENSTSFILKTIRDGHYKNRFALAGMLLKSIS